MLGVQQESHVERYVAGMLVQQQFSAALGLLAHGLQCYQEQQLQRVCGQANPRKTQPWIAVAGHVSKRLSRAHQCGAFDASVPLCPAACAPLQACGQCQRCQLECRWD
jgi:hypothetical protein